MAAKIMVVDDEENIRKLYEAELTAEGYSVAVASTGETALELLETDPPDLIVLDIKMDDKDGLSVLSSIKERRRDMPVVLNSAYSTYKRDFNSWLADAYVIKSSDLAELKTKIKELTAV
jgi:DNA-binding response OmpR family regulator